MNMFGCFECLLNIFVIIVFLLSLTCAFFVLFFIDLSVELIFTHLDLWFSSHLFGMRFKDLSGIPVLYFSPFNIVHVVYSPLHSHLSPHSFMLSSELTSPKLCRLTAHCYCTVCPMPQRFLSGFPLSCPCLFVDVKYEKSEVFLYNLTCAPKQTVSWGKKGHALSNGYNGNILFPEKPQRFDICSHDCCKC